MHQWNLRPRLLFFCIFCVIPLIFSANSTALTAEGINFIDIPSAKSVEDSRELFERRARQPIDFFLNHTTVGVLHEQNTMVFYAASLARLVTGEKVAEVNAALLDPASHVYAQVGTNFQLGPCRRKGDYDFALIGLVTLPYYAKKHPGLLSDAARQRLINTFLTERGRNHYMTFDLGICGTRVDTENHILMIEISRFLTNQILYDDLRAKGQYNVEYDNWATGFNYFLIDHLKQFLKNDFSEFNSKPYQAYSVMAIQTLYNHSQDSRVKLTAQMVLDYLSAKFAMQSSGLRRSVPFRRQPAYKNENRLLFRDGEAARHIILAGNYDVLAHLPVPYHQEESYDFMLAAALSTYRIPDGILSFMMNKGTKQVFQKFKHEGVEIYSASNSFTLAAGGVFVDYADYNTGELDAWAVPTTIVPSNGGILRDAMIRIEGHRDFTKRNNTCVARGFACGINPTIPSHIPQQCRETQGNWTFLNFNSPACPLRYGFYAAVFSKVCNTAFCKKNGAAQTFGFLEVIDAKEAQSFSSFKTTVLNKNGAWDYHPDAESLYETTSGEKIRFIPTSSDLTRWPIIAINGRQQERTFDHWPLAEGDFMRADRDARVMITNPVSRQSLLLDASDVRHPRRTLGKF